MNSNALANMTKDELNAYAATLGDAFGKTVSKLAKDEKVEQIQRKRERVAVVRVLGLDLSIPVKKRMDDENYGNLLDKPNRTAEDVINAYKFLLGEEQFEELWNACTDDDGTFDTGAFAYAHSVIATNEELKN